MNGMLGIHGGKMQEPKCDFSKKDAGQIFEEDKMMAKKITGPKSRLSWSFSDMKQSDWDRIFGRK